MKAVIPYEHRGLSYQSMEINDFEGARAVERAFNSEEDVWLRKILALKILAATGQTKFNLSDRELQKVIACQVG